MGEAFVAANAAGVWQQGLGVVRHLPGRHHDVRRQPVEEKEKAPSDTGEGEITDWEQFVTNL